MACSFISASLPLVLLLATLSSTCWSLQIPSARHGHRISPGHIRSSVMRHMSSNNDGDDPSTDSSTKVKFFELDDAFEDDGENVVGTKFFGGNTIKEELYIPEEEEMALELQKVKPKQTKEDSEYNRFQDANAFGDDLARRAGEALQLAINKILYDDSTDDSVATWKENPSIVWETAFPKANNAGGNSPLMEMKASKDFYNKLDVAILSAKTIESTADTGVVEVRWDVGAVWPNPWESRVLLTGTSLLNVRDDKDNNIITLLKQVDKLDGNKPSDIVGSLTSQLSPRFWDVYHIGMSPSAERDPRLTNLSPSQLSTSRGNKGLLSSYTLSHLPPRLVTEPSLVDTNGRFGRTAQALPNHGFTTAIKTMGPNKEEFVPVSPIEVSISKVDGQDGSLIKWTVPVPPEFASKAVLPLPVIEEGEDDEQDNTSNDDALATSSANTPSKTSSPYSSRGPNTPAPEDPQSLKCNYSLRPPRLVATLSYAGNPQDEEVTELRRQLYQQVVENDGFKPKLDPETKRPVFFFWMNDAKACFTRAGGLGMAVYEWRADWAKTNEIGIELEC
mmetsp:Transcript_21456/g.36416  ORF Transcript_21456/g.36416 Transcript_21456/m.36416 type:complete len:561 (+) Transcript_21456:109-1791(+)